MLETKDFEDKFGKKYSKTACMVLNDKQRALYRHWQLY